MTSLTADAVTKSFPGVLALDGVEFALESGEVHALMGENGAGKSTLIKVLTGALAPDAGSMTLDGARYAPHGVAAAQAAGVWAVHQELALLPNLSVAENLMLGREPMRFGLIDRRARDAAARDTLVALGIEIDVARLLGSYPVAVRQLVAIARAARADARVLVLDEPTASLDAAEVAKLFTLVRRLTAGGTAVVLITHFLDQAYALADRITVLRNGRRVGSERTAALPRLDLVSMMLGKGLEEAVERPARAAPAERAVVARFTGIGRRDGVRRFDLELRAGEAVGAAGLLGSGRTESAEMLFGAAPAERGSIEVDGEPARIAGPRDAIRFGFAFAPEERKTDGILAQLSVRENILIALQARSGWRRPIARAEQERIAERFIERLGIRTPDAEKPIGQLSGGNQQKALLARWLATGPRVLILDEPTRGIDVGAHAEIVRLIEELRDDGLALYIVSSELDELTAYADRVTVLRDREQVGMLEGDAMTIDAILAAIAGEPA